MRKVYMIGNTHFDPVWLWKWDEAMSSITATFRSALDRMKEFPEFKYSFTTPPVFEWIRHTNPEMFEEIKQRIAEGRWELAEGWWVQPDCYTPSGESLARQGLYAQRYLKENFGQYAKSVFNIDSFGHPPMLPQILSKSGIQYYVMCRPERKHVALDKPLFHWESRDGSRILAYRDDRPYQKETGSAIDEAAKLPYDTMLVYGVTDHGGAPTIRSLQEIRQRECATCATLTDFFENTTTDYTVKGELVTGDFGVYSDCPEIKKMNRTAEYTLLNAEKASVIAGHDETAKLGVCWKDVLFNQFHDILGGACIKEAYVDAKNLYGRAISTAKESMHYHLLQITNQICLPGKNPDNVWNIVVWNLNCHAFRGYVEAEVQWVHEFPWYNQGLALEDTEGNRYPCQVIQERSIIPRFRSRFVFHAQVPALGYKAYRLVQTYEPVVRAALEDLHCIETKGYTISLDENGWIQTICHKATGKKLANTLLKPQCFADTGDTWAFNVESYGEACEPFVLKSLDLVEKGIFRTILRATYSFRESKLELFYTIYEDEAYLDVKYRVNWNEKHLVLKLMTDVQSDSHTAAVSYDSIERGPNVCDVPVGEWLAIDDLVFTSESVFAYNLAEHQLGLTVLRSAIYGDLRLDDNYLVTIADYDYLSQGITEGCIRVHLRKHDTPYHLAAAFNNPPVVLCESNHTGTRPPCYSFASIDAADIHVTTLKHAEDGNGLILRGAAYREDAGNAKLRVLDREYNISVTPHEIFTLRIHDGHTTSVNILEE